MKDKVGKKKKCLAMSLVTIFLKISMKFLVEIHKNQHAVE